MSLIHGNDLIWKFINSEIPSSLQQELDDRFPLTDPIDFYSRFSSMYIKIIYCQVVTLSSQEEFL